MKVVRIAILGEIATALAQLRAPPSALDAHRLTKSSAKDLHSSLKTYGASPDLLAIVDRWGTKNDDAKTLKALQDFNLVATSRSDVGMKDDLP